MSSLRWEAREPWEFNLFLIQQYRLRAIHRQLSVTLVRDCGTSASTGSPFFYFTFHHHPHCPPPFTMQHLHGGSAAAPMPAPGLRTIGARPTRLRSAPPPPRCWSWADWGKNTSDGNHGGGGVHLVRAEQPSGNISACLGSIAAADCHFTFKKGKELRVSPLNVLHVTVIPQKLLLFSSCREKGVRYSVYWRGRACFGIFFHPEKGYTFFPAPLPLAGFERLGSGRGALPCFRCPGLLGASCGCGAVTPAQNGRIPAP